MIRPLIGIPIGDPAGIGPEIILKALSEKELYRLCRPLVIGDRFVLEQALKYCKLDLEINYVKGTEACLFRTGILDVIDMGIIDAAGIEMGTVQEKCGRAAYGYIKKAVDMALANEIDAIATAPINKESLKAANIDFIGHTEILAGLTNTHDPLTMFEVKNMRIFFLTRHVSLRKACDLITRERLLDYIERCTHALKSLGITGGTMAVAGLNPHSGEHGLFGDEELFHITPAILEAQGKGYNVTGPIGSDSVFHLALKGRFNSVLSLYHDQGHIAAKTLDFERTIALTIGLPFLRTSVDHGTAFDIAGTGKASPISMAEAIRLAAEYSPCYSWLNNA